MARRADLFALLSRVAGSGVPVKARGARAEKSAEKIEGDG